MPVSKYNAAQIRAGLKHKDAQFAEFLKAVIEETDDSSFLRYIDALLHRIYLLSIDGKFMTKMQACRMIPAKNATTCIKYVRLAEELEFITFEQDKNDKRRELIKPSPKLIEYVEKSITDTIDEIRDTFGDILDSGKLPLDNKRFHGLSLVEKPV